jgi:hypothetical protein
MGSAVVGDHPETAMIRKITTTLTLVALGLLTHCAADPAADEGEGASSSALSSSIHDSYGITMFGGSGDFQKMACGLSSHAAQQSNPYYVASSQRYGCKVHLKLTTKSGKCVVVSTEDAGPASWVETKAGTPILDSSPAVVQRLFGNVGSIGWSDLRKNPGKYSVTAVKTSLPLGPCNAAPPPAPAPAPAPTTDTSPNDPPADPGAPADPADPGTPDPGASPADPVGPACSSDGACNPGGDGSGQICQSGHCVPGCRSDAQCPGITTCNGGQCS